MAYTGSSPGAGTHHSHNFEVVGAGQRKEIALPDRPGDYSLHQGDIWKLDIVDDLGFLPGTCLKYVMSTVYSIIVLFTLVIHCLA